MRLAASLEPNSATIFHDLGLVCLEAGMPAEAAGSFRRATQLKPTFAHAFWRLGVALELNGEIDAAADALRKATELQPRLPEAQFRLGTLLEQLGHRHEAGERYRRVLTGGPPARLRRLAEARALLIEDRDEEAERKLRRAAEIEPSDVETLTLLGFVLTYSGAFEEAASCFERALAQPECGQSHLYYDLVRCRKITPRDGALLERLRSAAAVRRRADDTNVKLQLALGKALDDLGQYGEAMQAFDAAADVRARASPFDVAAFEQRVTKIIETFSGEFLAGKRSVGNPDPTPALIFGMPRSGTTLCEQIVSAHPSAHGAGELHFWNRRGAMMEAAAMNVGDEFFAQAADGLSAPPTRTERRSRKDYGQEPVQLPVGGPDSPRVSARRSHPLSAKPDRHRTVNSSDFLLRPCAPSDRRRSAGQILSRLRAPHGSLAASASG